MMLITCLAALLLFRLLINGGRHQLAAAVSGRRTPSPAASLQALEGEDATDNNTPPVPPMPPLPELKLEGPLPLGRFLHLIRQHWERLGLGGRQLSQRELEVLARKAGFSGGLHPDQSPLPPSLLAPFVAWLSAQMELIAALHRVYACCSPQLVAGFDIGRSEAVDALRPHPPGTFCLRLGSVEGSLVLSLVEEGSRGTCRINHYLLGAARLRLSGLRRALQDVPGCCRLLDVSTGHTHRPSILQRVSSKAAL